MNKSVVFRIQNKKYNLPTIKTNNKHNFDVLKELMLKHHYFEFVNNFESIYTNSDDYRKKVCYWIISICCEYDKVKKANMSLSLSKIIEHLINKANEKYRFNNSHCHLNYIGLILYWKYYKICRKNCNTICKFNEILKNMQAPANLTTELPTLLMQFDNTFTPIIKDVIQANKEFYEAKKQSELEKLDEKFRKEFKNTFDKYKSYLSKIRDVCDKIDHEIYEKIFIEYFDDCKYAIANYVLSKLLSDDYRKLSKKYPLITVDCTTEEITEMVCNDFDYYYEIGVKCYNDSLTICQNITKKYNEKCWDTYDSPEYKFDSNDHYKIIQSLFK